MIAALRKRIQSLPQGNDLRGAIDTLTMMETFVKAASNAAAERIKAQQTAIDRATSALDSVVRSRLTEEIAEARAAAQAALSEARKPRFQSDVLDALARADELAKQNPPDTEGATAATTAARAAHARILANALEDEASALRRPESFTESTWNALQSALADHLKSAQSGTGPDAARSSYEAALSYRSIDARPRLDHPRS